MVDIKKQFIETCKRRGVDPIKQAEKMMKEFIKEPDIDFKEIIEYLNARAGKNFRPSSQATRRLIAARARDGFTVDEFKRVIDNQVNDWLGTDMEQYLRPETLFRPSHFESYLNKKGARTLDNTLTEANDIIVKYDGVIIATEWRDSILRGQYPDRPKNTPYSKIEHLEEEALKLIRKNGA